MLTKNADVHFAGALEMKHRVKFLALLSKENVNDKLSLDYLPSRKSMIYV